MDDCPLNKLVSDCFPQLVESTGSATTLEHSEPSSVEHLHDSWDKDDQLLLERLVKKFKQDWARIRPFFPHVSSESLERRWTDSGKSHCWSADETQILLNLYQKFGADWKRIARCMNIRTSEAVKLHFFRTTRDCASNTVNSVVDELSIAKQPLDIETKQQKVREIMQRAALCQSLISQTRTQLSNLINSKS